MQAGQDARKNMAAPFVLVLSDATVAGYYKPCKGQSLGKHGQRNTRLGHRRQVCGMQTASLAAMRGVNLTGRTKPARRVALTLGGEAPKIILGQTLNRLQW
jgi:hypothetical protein